MQGVLRVSEIRPFGEYIKCVGVEEGTRESGIVLPENADTNRLQWFMATETGARVVDVEPDDMILTGPYAGLKFVDEVDGSECWLIRESQVLAYQRDDYEQ